jgi:hypothetical protein
MIGLQYHNSIPSKALIDGPTLSFTGSGTTQPFSTSLCSGNIATFTGVSTARFSIANISDFNSGILTHRWYEVGVGPLSDSSTVTGSGTTILTISDLRTPQDNNRRFFVKSNYIPPSNISQLFIGKAVNDGLDSSTATLTVRPNISITRQPESVSSGLNSPATISIGASTTDLSFGNLNYIWTSNGVTLRDGSNTIPIGSSIPVGSTDSAICISVIDESSPTASQIRSDWLSFRANYPNRIFWLLQPGGGANQLKEPSEYTSDSRASGPVQVNRDNGTITSRSDWFVICNLSSYPAGTVISLAVDTSGSMTLATVRASYDLFKQRCSQANFILVEQSMPDERWSPPHNKNLTTSTITTATTTVSGAGTSTITMTSNTVGIQTVQCTVSQSNSCNNNLKSNPVTFNVLNPRNIIIYESFRSRSTLLSYAIDLSNATFNNFEFRSEDNHIFHALEKDIFVTITMAGAAGLNRGIWQGGAGAVATFRYLMKKQQEYVFKIGDVTFGSRNGGGLGSFFYEGEKLIVAVGGGGGAGSQGHGGNGGAPGFSGTQGSGSLGGAGGTRIAPGTLPTIGFYAGGNTYNDGGGPNYNATTPGRVSACTLGGSSSNITNDYWRTRYSPCQSIGSARYRDESGFEISPSYLITRGYKPGLIHTVNGGNGTFNSDPNKNNGGGGSGATGGFPGLISGYNYGGGGGGSGYSDGSVSTLDSTGLNYRTSGYLRITLG